MGKRKSSKKPPPKKARQKLDTQFSCPFCNAEKAVGAELDREAKVGTVRCSQCSTSWSTKIHELSEAIDVYRQVAVGAVSGMLSMQCTDGG